MLAAVGGVRSHIPSWLRSVRLAIAHGDEVKTVQGGEAETVKRRMAQALENPLDGGPSATVTSFRARDETTAAEAPELTAVRVVGHHVAHLLYDLEEADRAWTEAAKKASDGSSNAAQAVDDARLAEEALRRAMLHALYLTFLRDARNGRPGQRFSASEYCQGWDRFTKAQLHQLELWIAHDGLRLGEEELPLAYDPKTGSVYRRAEGFLSRLVTASAPLWGGALAGGAIAVIFFVLKLAGITDWPDDTWPWQLLVLLLFVTFGAFLHLGSRVLNINYDDPIKVYDAGNLLHWLSLWWLDVLRMYIPIAVVVGSLWGAGNVPHSFKELGTAILAGYSADSLFRAFAERIKSQAANDRKAAETAG